MTTDAAAGLTAALADRYRVERELGQGGMATVYLADDLRHRRRVALKVLRPELAALIGGERFLHEITTTANLQHPHILPLFDSGQVTTPDPSTGGTIRTVFYVMPFVEGESLRDRLLREKQLPVDDAIRLAREVAGALHYAHRHGIVHRDIKPENILLHDGQALVADFGIALAASTAGGSRLTETGMSIGTPAYMSPEQAMGERNLDARSDVYALGCVLYEMLAGEPPFSGPTPQSIVARVMTETPRPLRIQRRTVPEHVEQAVLRALEKLPADRFTSAAEFADALSRPEAMTGASTLSRAPAGAVRSTPRGHAAAFAPWLLAGAAIAVATWALTRSAAPRIPPVLQYSLTTPEGVRVLDIGGPPVVLRPDGTGLVYVGATPGRPRQLVRWQFDGGPPEPIPGTDNALFPFMSPDGAWVGFVTAGGLHKVAMDGGAVIAISTVGGLAGGFRGATWTPSGRVVFATASGLQEVSAEGGAVRPIRMAADSPEQAAFFPAALPEGDDVLVALLNQASGAATELGVLSLDDGSFTLLGQPGSNPRYVEPGFLVFTSNEGSLLAARFDVRRRRITSPPRPIAQLISRGGAGVGKFDVGRNGTVAYLEGLGIEERQLLRVDRTGTGRSLGAPSRSYVGPRIAPDGRRIAVTIGAVPNPPMDVWVYDLEIATLIRLTFDSSSVHPEWAPDGRRLYHRRVAAGYRAMATSADGSAPPDTLYATTHDLWEVLPSRSGDTLITRELRSVGGDRDLLLVPLRPPGPAVPWAAGPGIQAEPVFSPDGRWLAYASDESGSFEVYVRAFPGPGPRYLVSSGGGIAPRWNPRGGEIFYLSRDSLVAVPVRQQGGTLELGRGRSLFSTTRYAPLNFHAPYDVSPDGTWFAFVGVSGNTLAGSFRLIHHWFDQPWR